MRTEYEPDTGSTRVAKSRLRCLTDLDLRTRAGKRALELVSAIESDLGGRERLSAAEREIAKRAALAGALAEDLETRWLQGCDIPIAEYVAAVNCQRRLLATVGLERRARDVDASDDDRQLARRLLALADDEAA